MKKNLPSFFLRFLSLVLSFSFIISYPLVTSAASSDVSDYFEDSNLINPNLTQWENSSSLVSGPAYSVSVFTCGPYYRFYPNLTTVIEPYKNYIGYTLDRSSLVAGRTYTFSVTIPDFDDIRASTDYKNSDSWFASHFVGGGYSISFGMVDSSGVPQTICTLLDLNQNTYQDYLGKEFVTSFTCPEYSAGDPCIFIYSARADASGMYFIGSDMRLVDNETEEDKGFFSKLFQFLQDKFQELRDSFEGFVNGIVSGFSTELRKFANFLLYFSWSEEVPDNPFEAEDSLLSIWQSFINKAVTYVSTINSTITSHIDSFSSGVFVFDYFVEEFPWLKGLLIFTLSLIVVTRFIGL